MRGGRFDGVKAIAISDRVARPAGVFAELGDLTADADHPLALAHLEPESAPDVEAEFWDTGERPPLRHRGLLGFRRGANRGREHDEPRDKIVGLSEAEAIEARRRDAREPVSTRQ